MNKFTLFPMGSYPSKIAGLVITVIAAFCALAMAVLGTDFFARWLSPLQQLPLVLWLLAFGLYIVAFSKEKIDDERVIQIRYTALRITASLVIGVPIAIALQPIFPESEMLGTITVVEAEIGLLMFLNSGLLLYHFIFQLGLRLDPVWLYNDLDETENIKRHPLIFLLFFVILTIVLIWTIVTVQHP